MLAVHDWTALSPPVLPSKNLLVEEKNGFLIKADDAFRYIIGETEARVNFFFEGRGDPAPFSVLCREVDFRQLGDGFGNFGLRIFIVR
jgi:hypothetical protein